MNKWNTHTHTHTRTCVVQCVPGKKPGTSTRVTMGRLKASQKRTKRAPLTEASMSSTPEMRL